MAGAKRFCPAFLLKAGRRVDRERKTSKQGLGMSSLAGQQEATQDLFTVSRIGATGETAEVAAEVSIQTRLSHFAAARTVARRLRGL